MWNSWKQRARCASCTATENSLWAECKIRRICVSACVTISFRRRAAANGQYMKPRCTKSDPLSR
ncbi:hypothetical protein KCP71_00515 [Salmonella enterica subsp. enterica]|nr:hypothetical protein KCP71_00515 [Salmonella enterica subsp. enterica]